MTREPRVDADYIELMHAQLEQLRRDNEEFSDQSREIMRAAMLELEKAMIEKFKVLREEHGLSQAELSARLAELGMDMHQTTIAKLEAGKRPLRVAEMFALSHVFRMPPGAVFFMPVSAKMLDGMEELQQAFAEEQRNAREVREHLAALIEQTIDTAVDHEYRQRRLLELLRESAGKIQGFEEYLEAQDSE